MTQTLTAKVTPSDLLRISDLDGHQFEHLLYQAACMKARPFEYKSQLPGRMISCYFEKPSTRTRVSFAGAAARLGMTALWLRPDELQLGRGEPIADTARVLAGYSAAITRPMPQTGDCASDTLSEWSPVDCAPRVTSHKRGGAAPCSSC